ncbi:SDR family NAD(P)-dependent oxidoreductase [Terriglobus roseus]|uniref:Short-chain dehydrogenase n=1 Tax=Terriglobus roseus TaxID=392734 RepID=A0A1H4N446_9BACT|nr:SDR family NAD(P)-dependent oxidoreductase [Terriglobus roseus]SEB89505.1 Short-chain dehydrogenase [Terriglobus roseus]
MSKVWMITGASRGLGLEIAKAALAAGDQVIAGARDAAKIASALGTQEHLLGVALDVTAPAQATAAVAAGIERFGRIDLLVNNAGYGHFGPFEQASADDVEAQYRVNVFGAMHVTRAVLPGMREQKSGRIFNISSIAGLKGGPMASLYCSSKFALEGWSESLAGELQPLGIQVTAVEPGFFRTEFLEPGSVRYTADELPEYGPGLEQMQAWLNGKSLQQEGDPAKLAKVLVDLAGRAEQPLHLLMGSDAIAWMEDRLQRDAKNVEEWRSVSVSTDFPQ